MSKSPQEHVSTGDSLRGERIAVEAREIDKIRYGAGSGRHKIQFTKLRDSAYCVIEAPMKSLHKNTK
jgi:hypothetical protein